MCFLCLTITERTLGFTYVKKRRGNKLKVAESDVEVSKVTKVSLRRACAKGFKPKIK